MNKTFGICLVLLSAFVFADTIYIVGADGSNKPTYWTISPSGIPSSPTELDAGDFHSGAARGVAFSSNQTVYIVGQLANGDLTAADYWTVSTSGSPSLLTELDQSNYVNVTAESIAFTPSGTGYIVGTDHVPNPVYWTVSPSGTVSSATSLSTGLLAFGVGFSSSGNGFIVGLDSSNNAGYWTVSNLGVVEGPFALIGGESGGSGSAYAVAVNSTGTAYIVGATTGGAACYWTVPPMGRVSDAIVLDGGTNSSAKDIALLSSGEGIIVGQSEGNVATYWLLSSDGTASTNHSLPNGIGSSSTANGVAFSSDQTAYIVGNDSSIKSAYWTLPLGGSPVYHSLITGDSGSTYDIAIYFSLAPNPPTALQGRYVTNDFALFYENCATLNWALSDSTGVVAYNIYKNGVQIGTVNGSTNQYENHDQDKSSPVVYTVKAIDSSGNESSAATVTLN